MTTEQTSDAVEWWRQQAIPVAEESKIERLTLQPGDIVVFSVPARLSEMHRGYTMDLLETYFPDHKILILDGGAKLSVVQPTSEGETEANNAKAG